jgi:hypothetical protein
MCFYPTQHQEKQKGCTIRQPRSYSQVIRDSGRHAHAPTILYNAYANASEPVIPVLLKIVILKCHEPSQHFCSISRCRFSRIVARAARASNTIDTATGDRGLGIVVIQTSGLNEIHRDFEVKLEVLACDNGTSNEGHEDDQDDEVENGITNHSALAKLGLLQGIDRRTDLTATTC